jgi:hypothetical protein
LIKSPTFNLLRLEPIFLAVQSSPVSVMATPAWEFVVGENIIALSIIRDHESSVPDAADIAIIGLFN